MIDMKNNTYKMPALFVGHGNPMNAIEQNEFTKQWETIGQTIPKPTSILCISAHWETRGTKLTAMPQPKTIHDFGGFPKELFAVEYPAEGNTRLALEISNSIVLPKVSLDNSDWGLDHGTWSVLKHIYPEANIPVVQMSLNTLQTPMYHYELAKQLAFLRLNGVLIIGSGNLVHNLGLIDWRNINSGHDWASEANNTMATYIENGNHKALIDFKKQGKSFDLAIPTPEHYLPLLYILALKDNDDATTIFNNRLTMGSLSMMGILIGEK
jgi:4,5-DOPA dioxygenase extradiol